MAIPTSLVGIELPAVNHVVDERWTMAYAAALDDYLPAYFDTTAPDGVVAHPLFAVCPEWPAIVSSRDRSIDHGVAHAEVLTSVHATHDVTIHRLIRPGDRLTTTIDMVGLVQKSPGAMSSTRLQTTDQHGHAVATTTQNGIYLNTPCDGAEIADPDAPEPLDVARTGEPTELAIPVSAGAAHTYTECARIWNPIHTDRAVALAAGLPDIILHGTANLAHGVSKVVALHAGGRPELVRRVACRFAAMVQLPSIMTVRVWDPQPHGSDQQAIAFDVLNAQGDPAVRDGVCILGASDSGAPPT